MASDIDPDVPSATAPTTASVRANFATAKAEIEALQGGSAIMALGWAKITDTPTTLSGYGITDAVPASEKGAANGVAELDATGHIPIAQLPDAVAGAVSYAGAWNAATNTPALASGTGTTGRYYVVSVAGSTEIDGIDDWSLGDWAVFNGVAWEKIDNSSIQALADDPAPQLAANLDANSKRITNVANPAAATDAVNRGYADARYGHIQTVVATHGTTETTTSGAFVNTSLSATITPEFSDSVIEAWAIVPAAQVIAVSGTPEERRGYFRIYNSTDGVDGPQSAFGHRMVTGNSTGAASAAVVMFMRYAVNSTAARTFVVQMRVQEVTSTQISTSASAAEMTLILRELRQ